MVRTLADLFVTSGSSCGLADLVEPAASSTIGSATSILRSECSPKPIDNPDQRIQQDIDIFTAGVGSEPNNPANTSEHLLLFGAVEAVLSVFTFGAILAALRAPDIGWRHA